MRRMWVPRKCIKQVCNVSEENSATGKYYFIENSSDRKNKRIGFHFVQKLGVRRFSIQ
mgnify:CR=1 FL=1